MGVTIRAVEHYWVAPLVLAFILLGFYYWWGDTCSKKTFFVAFVISCISWFIFASLLQMDEEKKELFWNHFAQKNHCQNKGFKTVTSAGIFGGVYTVNLFTCDNGVTFETQGIPDVRKITNQPIKPSHG